MIILDHLFILFVESLRHQDFSGKMQYSTLLYDYCHSDIQSRLVDHFWSDVTVRIKSLFSLEKYYCIPKTILNWPAVQYCFCVLYSVLKNIIAFQRQYWTGKQCNYFFFLHHIIKQLLTWVLGSYMEFYGSSVSNNERSFSVVVLGP